jgi:hypothetical protein
MLELQDAYRDGDDSFISELVSDWKRLGKPQEVPNPDPQRTIVNETPRAAVPERMLNDDDLQAAFQQKLEGKITLEDLRKINAIYQAQQKRVGAGK